MTNKTNDDNSRVEENDVSPEELAANAREYLEGWQRAKADFANLKKQHSDDISQSTARAQADLVESLLPTLDSFQMAFKDKEAWEQAPENWRQGIEYIYQQMWGTLEGHGLSIIDPAGDKFDPELHQAVEQVVVTDKSADSVIEETLQVGYKLSDKVLRPAKVKVGYLSPEN